MGLPRRLQTSPQGVTNIGNDALHGSIGDAGGQSIKGVTERICHASETVAYRHHISHAPRAVLAEWHEASQPDRDVGRSAGHAVPNGRKGPSAHCFGDAEGALSPYVTGSENTAGACDTCRDCWSVPSLSTTPIHSVPAPMTASRTKLGS